MIDEPDAHRYRLFVDDAPAGLLAYSDSGTVRALIHTEIDPAFEGHGLGGVLVRGALDDLRARGLQLRPVCPFVVAYLERHPELRAD